MQGTQFAADLVELRVTGLDAQARGAGLVEEIDRECG